MAPPACTTANDADRLIAILSDFGSVAVAFSGGVDSSVVAAAAVCADLSKVIAVTAQSPSLSEYQRGIADSVARFIGIEHVIVRTDEFRRDDYAENTGRRCYACKSTLYQAMGDLATRFPTMRMVSGTNADDLGDFRPGLKAGQEAGVGTPLADLGFGKKRVRELAKHFGLPNYDLPAAPCLASRIAYGTQVTPERLSRIESAEQWLRDRGFHEFRVRLHEGDLARIEVPRDQLAELLQLDSSGCLSKHFVSLGFRFVTIDLQGFCSGNLNQMLTQIQVLGRHASAGVRNAETYDEAKS